MKKVALYLYKKLCGMGIPLFGKSNVEADLTMLHPGERLDGLKQDYYVKKINLMLKILMIGILIGVVVKVTSYNEANLPDGIVKRPEFTEGEKKLLLRADTPDGSNKYVVEMMPKTLSDDEVTILFDSFTAQIDKYILGDNDDLLHIMTDLVLEETYDSFPFEVEWSSNKPEILSDSGRVQEVDAETVVELTVSFLYQGKDFHQVISVIVVPREYTNQELSQKEMQKFLDDAEFLERSKEAWELPKEWRGKTIHWSYEVEDYSFLIWFVTPIIAVLIYLFADKDLHGQLERRKRSLECDYPDIVHKLVLYIGAGMTVRSAVQKIGSEYEKRKWQEERCGYEEILYTCRELHAGVSEGTAYERFGKRTGVKDYIKLSSLLIQNLKRGNGKLQDILTEEAVRATESRLSQVRKLGEESGTKLLLPMVLMLGVAMLLILIPAFGVM